MVSRVPLQLLWKQISNSVKDRLLFLDYIHSQLSDATAYSYEIPKQTNASPSDKNTQSNAWCESNVYFDLTKAENIHCLQELFSEHTQCVTPALVSTTMAEDVNESALQKVNYFNGN